MATTMNAATNMAIGNRLHRVAALPLATLVPLLVGCRSDRPPGATIDLGGFYYPETESVSRSVEIRNTTSRTVELLGERHTCACQKVRLNKKKLGPGESCTLEITFPLTPAATGNAISCVVQTDHPEFPNWPYEIRFRSYPEIHIDAGDIHFGRCSPLAATKHEPISKTVDLCWRESASPIRISSVRAPPWVRCEFENDLDCRNLPDGFRTARAKIRCSIVPERLAEAPENDDVAVSFSNGRIAVLRVAWENAGAIETTPAHLFVMVQPGYTASRQVNLRSLDGKSFSIKAIRVSKYGLRCTTKDIGNMAPAPEFVLDFATLPLTAPAPFPSGEIAIDTTRHDAPTVVVRWSIYAKDVNR